MSTNPFAAVIAVDWDQTPILPAGAMPVACENAGPAAVILDDHGEMARMSVATAEREVKAGRIRHVEGNTYRACNARLDHLSREIAARAAAKRAADAAARQARYRAQRDGLVTA